MVPSIFSVSNLIHWVVDRARVLIIVFTLLGIVAGLSMAIFVQPIFSAEAIIKIGQIGTPDYDFGRTKVASELIENRSSLREVIYNKYRIHGARLKKLSLPYLVDVDKGDDPDVIKLIAYGGDVEEATQFLWSVVNWVIERHDRKISSFKERLHNHTALLDSMRSRSEDLIQGVSDSSNDNAWVSLVSTLEEYRVRADLALVNSYSSQIEMPPRASSIKIQPKPLLYLFTGMITGFALALLIIGLAKEWNAYRGRS